MSTPIPINTPAVIRTTGAGNTGADFINTIWNAISQAGTHWEVKKYTPNVGVLLGQISGNQYIYLRPVEGAANNIAIGIDPDGKINDPDGLLADFANIAGTASPAYSGGVAVFSSNSNTLWDSDDMSGKIDVVEMPDCLSVFFYGNPNAYYTSSHGPQEDLWYHGFQAGKIMSPDNPAEAEFGLDGLGIVCGYPGSYSSTQYTWIGTSLYSIYSNRIRTGLTEWGSFVCDNSGLATKVDVNDSSAENNVWRPVDGKLRLVPATISLSTGQVLGRSKYFRFVNREAQAGTVYKIPDVVTHGTHQAWIQRSYNIGTTTYNSNLIHLWTTMPITEI